MAPPHHHEDPLFLAQQTEDELLAAYSVPAPESQLGRFAVAEDVTLDVLASASQLLAQNSAEDFASPGGAAVGWGVPTCLAVHAKYVVVGTSRGLALMFDHFGALRITLTESHFKSVTCVDALPAQIVAAYDDGRVTLYDVASKQVLKAIEGNQEPVVFCKLVKPWCVVSVTNRGVVWITQYSRLFLVVSADRKCLFDGGLVSSCVAHVDARLLAITVPSATVVADLSEDVPRIAHRWLSSGNNPCPAATNWSPGALPLLARGWGKRIELLAKAASPSSLPSSAEWILQTTASVDCVVSAVDFANERKLVALLENYQICLVDCFNGQVIGGCDASHLAQIVVSTWLDLGMIYQNSLAKADDGLLYLLGLNELVLIKLQTWSKHVERLAGAGQWSEALAVAMNHYKKTVVTKAEQDQQLMSVIRDGSKVAEIFEDYLAQLDVSKLADDEAGSVCDLCIEYALGISRIDLIFNRVLERFAGRSHVFFARLIPFLLNNQLPTVSPHVLSLLSTHLIQQSQAKLVELVVLHLDVSAGQQDLDFLIKTLRAQRLFTGVCYVYNKGLGDYTAPVTLMVDAMRSSPVNASEVGHRLLLYLKYCFLGIAFPRGIMPERDQFACAPELLKCLFVQKRSELAKVLLDFDAKTFCRVVQTALDSPFYLQDPSRDVVFTAMLTASTGTPGQFPVLELISSYAQRQLVKDPVLVDALVDHLVQQRDEEALVALLERMPPKPGLSDTVDAVGLYRVSALVHRLYSKDPAKVMDAYLQCPDLSFAKLVFAYGLASEASEIRQAALDRAEALVTLDCSQAAALFAQLCTHEQVLDCLRGGEAAEAYLAEVVQTEPVVSPELLGRFLRQLVSKHPEQVHAWLSNNEARYSLDVALDACKGHVEATGYLLERAGRPDEALDLILGVGVKTESSALVACELCERNLDNGELWFRVLDSVVGEGCEEELVGLVLQRMLPHVALDRVLAIIATDFWRFQRALESVGVAFKLQLGALQAAKRVAEADEFALGTRKRAEGGRGIRMRRGPAEPSGASAEMRNAKWALEDEYDKLRWQAVESQGQVDLGQAMLLGTGYELVCGIEYNVQ